MKKITIGILAHVDAGKTTLSEAFLYKSGILKKTGRVDHQDSFFDFDIQERNRGITIYSKYQSFTWKDTLFTLLDTPGHVDFLTEMERTIQVLDYAIVVINASDGIQSHTKTIFQLLEQYQIPVFIFVNKMDISNQLEQDYIENFKIQFNYHCVNFMHKDDSFYEDIALTDERMLEFYIQNHQVLTHDIQNMIQQKQVIPCFFGSALHLDGIVEILDDLDKYTVSRQYDNEFGARVFKVSYDYHIKLVHIKMLGGVLKVKTKINDEKVNQIRIYSGDKYKVVDEICAGDIATIVGLNHLSIGEGLGNQITHIDPYLVPYMQYQLLLPKSVDSYSVMPQLEQLQQVDPMLQLEYHHELHQIHLCLMGEIQIEILKQQILDRFGLEVEFQYCDVLYKETITQPIEGVGHFEPLKHYAEVHVLLEPLPRGSGILICNQCDDVLLKQYQSQVMANIQEKKHIGVLIGAPITDIKITLVAGKAHVQHSTGGDFKEATIRAIRQGLRQTTSIVLEPYYHYELCILSDYLGKAIHDIENMHGDYQFKQIDNDHVLIIGYAPVVNMHGYNQQVAIYTKGSGKLTLTMGEYRPCHNEKEVIERANYHCDQDIQNPCDSIFCKHGAGFVVKSDNVYQYMHVPLQWATKHSSKKGNVKEILDSQHELDIIFEKTYGKTKRYKEPRKIESIKEVQSIKMKQDCLLVDGYNIIFSWDTLNQLAKENLDASRQQLIHILSNYQGYRKCILIIVFDAYKVKGGKEKIYQDGNVYVVYTKQAHTADMYIERITSSLVNDYHVTVASSDGLEQLTVFSQGANRMSARELQLEVEYVTKTKLLEYQNKQVKYNNNYVLKGKN